MTEIFATKKIIGMSFHCDLQMMGKELSDLNYFKQINNLYEMQFMFAKLYEEKKN